VGKVCRDLLHMAAVSLQLPFWRPSTVNTKQAPQAHAADANSARILIKAEVAEGQQLRENLAPGTGEPCRPNEGAGKELGCWPELARRGTRSYGCAGLGTAGAGGQNQARSRLQSTDLLVLGLF